MKGSRSLWVTPLPCSTASHRPGDVFTSTTPQVQGSARSDNHLMGIYTFFKKEKNFTNKTKQENPITPTNNNKNPGKVLGSWGVVPRASAQQTSPSFELLTLLQPQRSAHGAKCPHSLSRPQLSFPGSRAGPSPLPPGARTVPQQPAARRSAAAERTPAVPSRAVPPRPVPPPSIRSAPRRGGLPDKAGLLRSALLCSLLSPHRSEPPAPEPLRHSGTGAALTVLQAGRRSYPRCWGVAAGRAPGDGAGCAGRRTEGRGQPGAAGSGASRGGGLRGDGGPVTAAERCSWAS